MNDNNGQKDISTSGHVQHLIKNLFKKLPLILIEFTWRDRDAIIPKSLS